jgi:hypothetical protein
MSSKPKDITGNKYGKLTALENTFTKNNGGNYIWKFTCDCGNEYKSSTGNILSGHTKSCGCYMRESVKERDNYHGLKETKEYKSWCKAKERCFNPACKTFSEYGAKGITMSAEFSDSFKDFLDYIGMMHQDGRRYTLDRIENSKGYERGNIRWATNYQQARNKTFQTNNTSGFSGVSWDAKTWKGGVKLYAKAQWNKLEGGVASKRFSVDMYGLLPSFKLACEHRLKMIEQLNSLGAGYSENHGK